MSIRTSLITAILVGAPVGVFAQKQAADTTSKDSDSSPSVTYGATAGVLSLSDGRTQSGASAVLRWHMPMGFALGVSPSYASLSASSTLGTASASGLTDVPVELTFDHTFPGVMPATIGAGFTVSLPVGDTVTGLGSGSAGYSIGAGLSVSPSDQFSFHVGAGKPLSDYSPSGALGGSDNVWGDAEATYQFTDRIGGTFGFDGDIASSDTVLGASRALAGGLAFGVAGPLTLTVNAAKGISGAAANWTFSVGLGTDFANLQSLGSSSPIQRVVGALGGQSHGQSTLTHGQSGTHGGGTSHKP